MAPLFGVLVYEQVAKLGSSRTLVPTGAATLSNSLYNVVPQKCPLCLIYTIWAALSLPKPPRAICDPRDLPVPDQRPTTFGTHDAR
jgi:hypothetical protein